MSYENCGSAHQIEELDCEFDSSAIDLNNLLDKALSRKHTKHDYEDPIIHHFSRYNSNHLIRLHAADKSFNSYEGGSVAELTNVEIHRDENDFPINHHSNSSTLQNRIDTRDKRPHSDAPLQNIHENSKLTTNKSQTSSAKRLDVLEEQQQDGNKVPHYFKDQYQNSRKTSTAKDDYGFSGEFNKNSHSEANQSHPYNNNSLTDSEKISEIMHMAYLKGRGQGTEHSDGSAGIEFMSKEPSMIELSNKDFENSPKATEEDDLEEYKYDKYEEPEQQQQQRPVHHQAQLSTQLREILVPISQAENESEDSDSERISPSDLRENENIRRAAKEGQREEEVIAIDNRKGSIEYKRDEKAMRGQRNATEVSPASASESIDEFVASRFSGISPRDPRGSITKGDILTEGQLLSSRSQKEEERVETQENRETEGDQPQTHERIQEQSEEEEEIENFKTCQSEDTEDFKSCQSQELFAEGETGGLKRINQEERTDVIQEQEEEYIQTPKRSHAEIQHEEDMIAEAESEIMKRVNQVEEVEASQKQTEEENIENTKRSQHQETENIHEENNEEIENIKISQEEAVLGTDSNVIEVSNQEQKVNEGIDAKDSNRKELAQVDSSKDHQKISQSEEGVVNASSENIAKTQAQENESIAQIAKKEKTDSNNVENHESKQAENIIKKVKGNPGLRESEIHDVSERRPTLEENIQENDQMDVSAIRAQTQEVLKTEGSDGVEQYFPENIQKKEIKNENQTGKVINSANDQESIQNSKNKVGDRNEKEIESNNVENKEKIQADKNSNERIEEARNVIEHGSGMNESEVQGAVKEKQALEENNQENAQKDSSVAETKTQEEELAKTDNIKSSERVDQGSSEAVQKKEEKAIHSVQADAQEESVNASENRVDENQGENAHNEKEETQLKNTENQENKKDERVEETRNFIEQGSEGTSETRQALEENAKEDSQKNSYSPAQETIVKTDGSQQNQNEKVNIENKTQNDKQSVNEDAQKESLSSSENRVDNHGENLKEDSQKDSSCPAQENVEKTNGSQQSAEVTQDENTHIDKTQDADKSVNDEAQKESIEISGNRVDNNDKNVRAHEKDLANAEETQVSGNAEKSAEEQNHQAVSHNDNQNQKVTNATAEAEKRSDGENVLISEQKQEIEGQESQRREATLEEETKEAREEHKKGLHESKLGDQSEGGKLEGSNIDSVKELDATEATARNRENDADNLTETHNETDGHTEKLDEKLISAFGSVKEIEGEEGTTVNHDAQKTAAGEISATSNVQEQEVNETEKRQNKLVSNAESVKKSEALEVAVIVEGKSSQEEENSGVQVNSEQDSSPIEVITREIEAQKKQEENGVLSTDQQEVKSGEDVTSNTAIVDSIKDSEASETITASQENQILQAQNNNGNSTVQQQNEEIEKSQEKLGSAVEGSFVAAKNQENKTEKKLEENEKRHPEAHHKEEENVNQHSENVVKINQQSDISDVKQSSDLKNNQGAGQQQQHQNENSSSISEVQQEERSTQSSHQTQNQSPKTEVIKKDSNIIASETTKINSTHNNTIDENHHKSSSEIVSHNILDMTTQTNQHSEIKRSSNTTSPQKDSSSSQKESHQSVLDHNDKVQINKLLEQIQEEESKENMISPQHFQTQQEQQEFPNNVAVSTPVKSKKAITTTTASTGTDFILHKTQIEEKGTQTEAEPEEKEAPPIIPVQKVTHFRSLSTTKKKQRSTFRLFEKSVGEYEKDIDFMSKYTTKEVMQNLDQTPEQMEALFESAKKLYKIGDETPRGPPSDDELDGILNRIVVARSPVKEGRYDHSLIPIYQQVEETYEDGTRYEGEKFLGKRHGTGTYYYKEGYKYVGNWDQDVMSGFGVLWLNETEKWYEGEWVNNVFHGRGSLYNTNPEKLDEEKNYLENFDEIGHGWQRYEGQFLEGKRHRFGTILLSNGDVFVGNFKENKAEGRGSYTKANKKMIVGEWCDNKLKKTF